MGKVTYADGKVNIKGTTFDELKNGTAPKYAVAEDTGSKELSEEDQGFTYNEDPGVLSMNEIRKAENAAAIFSSLASMCAPFLVICFLRCRYSGSSAQTFLFPCPSVSLHGIVWPL